MTGAELLVVLSLATAQQAEWQGVADALVAKHAQERVSQVAVEGGVTNAISSIRAYRPRYVAFVMRPDEIDFATTVALKRMMRAIDDDPFDDAIWGIVTGPTAADARRIAASNEPREIKTALATTGIGDDLVPGPLYCLSDGYPEGCWRVKSADGTVTHHSSSNDIAHVFAEGWNALDPDLLLTSSHATQFNLEMPFSRGNLVPREGKFVALDRARIEAEDEPQDKFNLVVAELRVPVREKIWIAAGNCLIADNLGRGAHGVSALPSLTNPAPTDNMVMTALGFGKVNQFVGYTATTWFGEIGWTTWRYFWADRLPLNVSYYAANQVLLKEIAETVSNAEEFRPVFASAKDYDRLFLDVQRFAFKAPAPIADQKQFVGRLWDRDATVFYGDPRQAVALASCAKPLAASDAQSAPIPIIFRSARKGRRLVSAPEGFEVFVADDFALVTKWPALAPGWREKLVFD